MAKSLIVIQILPALNKGGVERGTVEMANYLAAQGHTSIVVSAGGFMQEQLTDAVEHICIPVGKKSLVSLLKIKKIRQLILAKKADIVHARSRLPAWLVYRALAKIMVNKPIFITTVHGLYSVKKYSSIMACGDKVIAVSQTSLDYVKYNYAQYLRTEPQLIYRGINPDEFHYGHKPDVLWLQKFYNNHPELINLKTVLLPGRLSSLKGAKDLLIWLKNNDGNAKLLFTAKPKDNYYTEKLYNYFRDEGVENQIVWVGEQNRMAELYALVDIVVSTSKRPESFGRTVLEALAVGTPVVGYNHGGVGEILSQIFPAGKINYGNAKQLSDKINTMLSKKPKVPNKQPFILQNMLEQTLSLYLESCKNDK